MSHTTTDTPTLPAAWYRDPSGRHERRWWDGAEWTDRVADGDTVGSDPPVRSDPTASATATATEERTVVTEAASAEGDPDETPADDPLGGFDQLRPARRRPPEGDDDDGPDLSKAKVAAWVGIAVAVVLALGWGLHNYRTADQWRDRSEALEAELVTSESNADAVEQALSRSASRSAGLRDGQEFFAELQGAARASADQLRACANDLNAILNQVAGGGDPLSLIDRANATCGQAAVNGEALIALLDQLA